MDIHRMQKYEECHICLILSDHLIHNYQYILKLFDLIRIISLANLLK